jgi:transposase InsO family protein
MNRALTMTERLPESKRKPKAKIPPVLQTKVDIALVGATAFRRHERNKTSDTFVTTLVEIEKVLHDKRTTEEEEEEVLKKLPPQYHKWVDVFSKEASDTLPPSRGYDHHIELEERNTLGYSPLYKMSVEELEAAKQYLVDNLRKGFIIPSDAPFGSPILMARKPDGGLRFCVDYRRLNAITKKNRYPLPLIDEILERVSKAKIFTKLDIRQGFHRIRMHPDSEDLTTFRTRYGSYKYKVMPFGLTNGPATFQHFMNDTFMDYLDDFLTIFIDDLLIYSNNELEHEEHVKKVLTRLREAGLQASIKKCDFHVTRTKYLGFIISTEGIEVDPEKTAVIRDWEQPTTVKGIQSFLGFCNFYRKFIPEYSRIARPLSRLTRQNIPFDFNDDCRKAFQTLKDKLLSAPILAHYHPDRPTLVETDASQGVVAGVLSQLGEDKCWHPIAFYSKTMEPAECNYPIHDKELLAIVRALKEWRPELEGLQANDRFEILSDHRALEYFMATKELNSRQARWAEFLSRFHFTLKYRPGKQNTLADALSRQENDVQAQDQIGKRYRTQILLKEECLDTRIIRELKESLKSQETEVVQMDMDQSSLGLDEMLLVDKLISANRTSPTLAAHKSRLEKASVDSHSCKSDYELRDGLLLHKGRLVVPTEEGETLKVRLLDEVHKQASTAHPGRAKTKDLVKKRYFWPGMGKYIDRYVANCHTCRRTHAPKDLPPGLLSPLPIPERPWQHISMDFQSLPKDKHGYDAIFVVVDRLSKRAISIPCHKTTDAKEMARLFLIYVYRYKGAPLTIVSDRGGQFISAFWKEFCKLLGTKLKLSTAFHAQTDGQTEIMNQYIALRLRPYVNYYQDDWSEWLPMIDFANACLFNESTRMSPFFIENGYEPRLSFDWDQITEPTLVSERANREDAREFVKRMEDIWRFAQGSMKKAQVHQKQQADRRRRPVDFNVGDYVWVTTKEWKTGRPSRKLDMQMAGPYRIMEQAGNNAFKLDLPSSIKVHPVINASRLRKAATDPVPGQHPDPPPPIEVNGDAEWEVERILASRLYRKKTLQYKAKWVGYDDDATWYPARNFANSPHHIRDFHRDYPHEPGPPKRLYYWLECWENEEDPRDHPDDDIPA